MEVDPATFAAIGMVALLSGAANTPIAASILAVELFGPALLRMRQPHAWPLF